MSIERHGSGGPYEEVVGYARVVRAGPHVWVSGCTAVNADGIVLGTSAGEQTTYAIDNLLAALAQVGAAAADVVRTRLYVTDVSRWEEIGRAHGAVFGAVRPATAMVEVQALIDPRMVVEIEADAYVA